MRPARTLHPFNWILPVALLVGSVTAMAQDRSSAAVSAKAEKLTPFRTWMRSLGLSRQIASDDRGILITESSLVGPRRSYQKWKDATGREFEVYQEKGQVKPVDAEVKAWVESALREGVPPPPPAPPSPPPVPDVPPIPSLSDSRQAWSDSEWGRAILARVQSDAHLAAMLGSPISMARGDGLAHINTWEKGEPHGFSLFSPTGGMDVELNVSISGPKGAVLLAVKAQKRESEWTFSKLETQPSQGGSCLNLLSNPSSPK